MNHSSAATFTVVEHRTAASFLGHAGPWLLEREAEHNLLLGIAQRLASIGGPLDPSILLATVEQGGAVVGCAFRTPPHKLGLTGMPLAAVPPVVDAVARRYDSIPAVLGPADTAHHFARLWSERRQTAWQEGVRHRIYQLDAVTWPEPIAAGALRPATAADLATVRAWTAAFARELHMQMGEPEHAAEEYVGRGVVFLWEDRWVRAMAAIPAATPNGARIGYVYTPPEWRGRGYASACVAHLSHAVLQSGSRYCFLYTDLANPVSNAMYQRMGYHPVCDVLDCTFTAEVSA